MEPTPKSDDPRPEADDDLFAPPSAATEAMLAQLAQMAARPADRVPLPPPPEFAAGPRVPPSLDIAPIPIDDTPQPRRRLGRLAVAAGIGVALVLGWLSYGDAAKQVMTSPLAG